jgi:hypothetical protein
MKALRGIRWFGFIVAVCIFTVGLTTDTFCGSKDSDEKAKQVVVEARKIKNPEQVFEVKLWAEGDKKEFKAGDTISFKFKASENAYVTLLDISTDGSVHKIFPNKWHKSGKVEKGKEYRFPPPDAEFVFRVKGPGGVEYIKAIASLVPLQAVSTEKTDAEQPVTEVQKPEEAMKRVAVELKKRDKKTWAESLVSFIIAEVKPEKEKKEEKK